MTQTHEVEALREQLQRNHIEHVRVEIELAITFFQLSDVERSTGDVEASATSLRHAHQAIQGARKGLRHITASEQRAMLEPRIAELERNVG